MEQKEFVHVNVRCPVDLDREVRVEAAKRDLNRTQFILAALREKLGRCEAENEKKAE